MMTAQQDAIRGPQGTMVMPSVDGLRPDLARPTAESLERLRLVGAEPGSDVEFVIESKTTIGRNPDNDIVLDDPSVSSRHAQIVNQDGQWRVMNLLSSNGTFVNGRKISVRKLGRGDLVRLGRTSFRVAGNNSNTGNQIWLWLTTIVIGTSLAASFILR